MAPQKNTPSKTPSKKAAPAKAKAAVKKTAPAKKTAPTKAAPKKTTAKQKTPVVEAWTPEVASSPTVNILFAPEKKKGRRRFFLFGRRKQK